MKSCQSPGRIFIVNELANTEGYEVYKKIVGSDHVKSLATVPIVINELDIRAVNLSPLLF